MVSTMFKPLNLSDASSEPSSQIGNRGYYLKSIDDSNLHCTSKIHVFLLAFQDVLKSV